MLACSSLRLGALCLVLALGGCDKKVDDRGSSTVDFTDSKRVLSSVFYAAQSGHSEHLATLCDPEGEANSHALRICSQVEGSDEWKAFVEQFSKGRLIGEARIAGDRALVNFVFGKSGTQRETMELVRRDGRWYLLAF
jgi:hypothetical protein